MRTVLTAHGPAYVRAEPEQRGARLVKFYGLTAVGGLKARMCDFVHRLCQEVSCEVLRAEVVRESFDVCIVC